MQTDQNIFFRVTERDLFWKDKHDNLMPTEHKQLLRVGDNGEPIALSVVKKSYKVIHNTAISEVLSEAIGTEEHQVKHYWDRDGAKCYFDYTFPNIRTSFRGHDLAFRAIFWNGYGGTSLGCMIGAIFAFCTNGMRSGDFETTYRRHTAGIEPELAARWLRDGRLVYDIEMKRLNMMTQITTNDRIIAEAFGLMVDHEEVKNALATTYATKYVPTFGNNIFSLYQTLTDYATHNQNYALRKAANSAPHEKEMKLLTKADNVISKILETVR